MDWRGIDRGREASPLRTPQAGTDEFMIMQTAVICDAATESLGKLNLLGAFDTLSVANFPSAHPQCALALRVIFDRADEGEHFFGLFRVFRGILDWVGIRVSRLGVHGMRLRRRLFLGRKWRGPQPLGLFCARRGRVPRGQATAPPARARRRPTSLAPLGSISSSSFPWMVDPEFCGFRSHRLSSPS
jgi:hypothetical protein